MSDDPNEERDQRWEQLGEESSRERALTLLREARGLAEGAVHRIADALGLPEADR
jgi:hypothetical protein